MASLTGNLISSTYQSILKIGTNNTASANLNNVTDGEGNVTGLYVSTTATQVSGSFSVLGNMNVSGALAATASQAVSASHAITASHSITTLQAEGARIALTASFVNTAQTASLATNAITFNSTASAIFAITGSNTFTGTQVVSGSLRLYESATFILPTNQPATAIEGTAFFSGSFLYIYDGSAYKSASFS